MVCLLPVCAWRDQSIFFTPKPCVQPGKISIIILYGPNRNLFAGRVKKIIVHL